MTYMCGIAGIIGVEKARAASLAREMEKKIAHRGPDDSSTEFLGEFLGAVAKARAERQRGRIRQAG